MTPWAIALISISLLLLCSFLVWLHRRFATLRDLQVNCADSADYSAEELPSVSIIVYACNDAINLSENLPALLHQEYPGQFEVIVVNDGSSDNSKDILSDFQLAYRNMYQTFIPAGTVNVSRKKLALMLGIKAAKHDIILTTNANCRPLSEHWLKMMIRHFSDSNVDVVIGASHYDFAADKKLGHSFRAFDSLHTSVQYLYSAAKGTPYRGVSDNLAYRKEKFFAIKGFAHSMYLHHGDDDLFVNEIANEFNTCVELSPESIITAHYDNTAKAHRLIKLNHDFTAKLLPRSPFLKASAASAAFLFGLIALAAFVAVQPLNLVAIVIAAVVAIASAVIHIIEYRNLAKVLGYPKLMLLVPFFTIWRPFSNINYKISGHTSRKSNYTWQRRR